MNIFFDADSVCFVTFMQKQKKKMHNFVFTIRLRLFCKVTSPRARHLAMFSWLGTNEHRLFRHVAPVRSKYKIHVNAKQLAFRLAMHNQTMSKFENTFRCFVCSFTFKMPKEGDKKKYVLHIKGLDTLFNTSLLLLVVLFVNLTFIRYYGRPTSWTIFFCSWKAGVHVNKIWLYSTSVSWWGQGLTLVCAWRLC